MGAASGWTLFLCNVQKMGVVEVTCEIFIAVHAQSAPFLLQQ